MCMYKIISLTIINFNYIQIPYLSKCCEEMKKEKNTMRLNVNIYDHGLINKLQCQLLKVFYSVQSWISIVLDFKTGFLISV